MKYSTILWDMDGVLMDSEQQHWRAWERTFTQLFGIDRIDWEVYKHTIGVRYEVVAELYERTYGVDIREESVKERYFHHKAEVEREEGYFLPGFERRRDHPVEREDHDDRADQEQQVQQGLPEHLAHRIAVVEVEAHRQKDQ